MEGDGEEGGGADAACWGVGGVRAVGGGVGAKQVFLFFRPCIEVY